jgi:hypothetical protein
MTGHMLKELYDLLQPRTAMGFYTLLRGDPPDFKAVVIKQGSAEIGTWTAQNDRLTFKAALGVPHTEFDAASAADAERKTLRFLKYWERVQRKKPRQPEE